MEIKNRAGRRERMRRLLLCVISLMLAAACLPVMAAEKDQKGSITVDIQTASGTAVGGGELTLYKVADANDTNSDGKPDTFEYTDVFKGSFNDSLSEENINEKNQGAPALAKKLADYAVSKVEGTTTAVNANGQAGYSDLEAGVYLVVQNKAADGYRAISPFVVTVPRNGSYEVSAKPKPQTAATVAPTPAVTHTPVPTKTPQTSTPQTKLPQTGQYWWPVPILLAAGALSLISGLAARRRSAAV